MKHLFMSKRKPLALMLTVALMLGMYPMSDSVATISMAEEKELVSVENYGLHNPVTERDGTTTWDCVYFGNYWQTDTNGDSKADKNDDKQPIKWRVLSVDGDNAFLMADKILDSQKYEELFWGITWETCRMRSWLNGYEKGENDAAVDCSKDNFMDNAFTIEEQQAILPTMVESKEFSGLSIVEGRTTQDKIYLLSLDEVKDSAYGFPEREEYSAMRETVATEFKWNREDWALRSPGRGKLHIVEVLENGRIDVNGDYIIGKNVGVRPVLHLNLAADTSWSYAGTVVQKEKEIQKETPIPVSSPGIYGLRNPGTDSDDITTWDCVYFGRYWQNDTNGDKKADKNDDMEPIKWRVLSVDGNDAFLLSDKNLDVQKINGGTKAYLNDTWETCEMRRWLNDTFLNRAFDEVEQEAIRNTTLLTLEMNHERETEDKVYLLSCEEAISVPYGFSANAKALPTRVSKNTAYVADGGEIGCLRMEDEGCGDEWWLRSWASSGCVSNVMDSGFLDRSGFYASGEEIAVRPALHLNLACTELWEYAGTVSAERGEPAYWFVESGESGEPSAEPGKTAMPSLPIEPEQTVQPLETPTSTEEPPSENPSSPAIQTPGVSQGAVAASGGMPNITQVNESVPSMMPVQASPGVFVPGKVVGLRLKGKKKALQVSWKKCNAVSGYEIWYSTSKKFETKKKKTVKSSKYLIKRWKKKKTCYIKVRAYKIQKGKKVYGAWSRTIKNPLQFS